MKTKSDLSKIDYKLSSIGILEKPGYYNVGYGDFDIMGYDFIRVTFWDKKGDILTYTWLNHAEVTYILPDGAKTLLIKINIESLVKENVLEEKESIYKLLGKILTSDIPYNISIPNYEITTLGDDERKFIGPTAQEVMMQSLISALGADLALQIKLKCDIPITFENIEHADNIEIREQALRKFGYERYIEEGWNKGRILTIITGEEILMGPKHKMYNSSLYEESRIKMLIKHTKEECIIYMDNEISFLKVRDASNSKIYFLKIPPDIQNIKEAKAWTFGLTKGQYEPLIET